MFTIIFIILAIYNLFMLYILFNGDFRMYRHILHTKWEIQDKIHEFDMERRKLFWEIKRDSRNIFSNVTFPIRKKWRMMAWK